MLNGKNIWLYLLLLSLPILVNNLIKSFNTAWTYRFPTFVLADGYQAKMREPLVMYDPEERGMKMVEATPFVGLPGMPGKDRPAAHLRNTFSVEEELYEAIIPIHQEYEAMIDHVVEWEEEDVDEEASVETPVDEEEKTE